MIINEKVKKKKKKKVAVIYCAIYLCIWFHLEPGNPRTDSLEKMLSDAGKDWRQEEKGVIEDVL